MNPVETAVAGVSRRELLAEDAPRCVVGLLVHDSWYLATNTELRTCCRWALQSPDSEVLEAALEAVTNLAADECTCDAQPNK